MKSGNQTTAHYLTGSAYQLNVKLMPKCFCCKITKPKSYFYELASKRKDGRDYWVWCMQCLDQDVLNIRVKTNYRDNGRNAYLAKYGLNLKSFNKFWKAQGGRCAICKTWTHPRPLNVDHDHKTGKVRGLLCTRCNVQLGKWRDVPPVQHAQFIQYLSQ